MKKTDWKSFDTKLDKKINEIMEAPSSGKNLRYFFERVKIKEQISSYRELDSFIFQRMYERNPENSEVLKIRYWRCGTHLPKSREEMILLGKALEVSDEELDFMLKEILLETGLHVPEGASEFFKILSERYLALVPDERLGVLHIQREHVADNLRHILFADVMDCLSYPEKEREWYYGNHVYSRNFASECARFFKNAEVPGRSAAQRLLMVMLMPEISQKIMDDCLRGLGYAPLSEEIQRRSGAYADRLFLWILAQFDKYRSGDIEKDRQVQKAMMERMDAYIVRKISEDENGKHRKILQDLRIMKFRSFGTR